MPAALRTRAALTAALLLVLALLLPALATPAAAQFPDKFSNLKVLPKDIDKNELRGIMRNFSIALGVRCDHCHVETHDESGEEQEDFAADDKEPKLVARDMLKMVGEINGKLLPATGRKDLVQVRCLTCHRGLKSPATIDQVMTRAIERTDVDSAIAEYRGLRTKHYGDGAYDFTSGPLSEVAEQLARGGDNLDGALKIARLDVEMNPDSSGAHVLLGQILAQKGDKAAAIDSLNKALELEPDNPWIKRLLSRLEPPPRQPSE